MSKFDGKFGRISYENLPEYVQNDIYDGWAHDGLIDLIYKLDENHYGILDIKPVMREKYFNAPIFLCLDSTESLEYQLRVIRLQPFDESITADEEWQEIARFLDCSTDEVGCAQIRFGDIPVPYTVFYRCYCYDEGVPSLFSEKEESAEPILHGNLLIAAGIDPITGKLNGLRPFDIDELFKKDCIALFGSETDDNPNRFVFVTKGKERSEK